MIRKQWLLPALLAFGLLTGCTKGYDDLQGDETVGAGYVMLDAGVRTFAASASIDPNARGAAEYVIRRVRLYAFDGDKLDNMVYMNLSSGSTDGTVVRMKVRQTAGKTLYAIVNEPTDAAIQSRLALINNPAAFAGLEYAMADYFNNSQKAFNSAATFAAGDFCMPMSGKLGPFNAVSNADIPVTLPVTRSLARVDVMVQKNTDVSSVVTIKSTTTLDIVGTRAKGFLFADRLASGQSGDLNDVTIAAVGTAAGLVVPMRNAGNNNAAVRAFSFYTPERDCIAKKLGFKLNGVDFSGRALNYEVAIGDQDANKLTKIERNKVYRIWCSFKSVSTDVETQIFDWDDVAVTGDIGSATLLVLDRSRVVMDYVPQHNSFSTQVNFSSDNKVSFVGYVIKNTDRTDKSVTTDGSNLPTWLPKANITGLPDGKTVSGTIGLKYEVVDMTGQPTEVLLRIKTGNIVKDIAVVYDNGLLPKGVLETIGRWDKNQPDFGLQLAKRGNVLPSGVALDRDRAMPWSPLSSTVGAGAQNSGVGFGTDNTSSIMASTSGPGSVAAVCRAIGPDWYLSSKDELLAVFKLRNYVGLSYSFYSNYYWSSTEYTSSNSWYVGFYIGDTYNYTKPSNYYVRCVRNY